MSAICTGTQLKTNKMKKQTALKWFIEQLTQVNKNSINKPSLQLNRSLSGDKLKEIIMIQKKLS